MTNAAAGNYRFKNFRQEVRVVVHQIFLNFLFLVFLDEKKGGAENFCAFCAKLDHPPTN